LAPSISINLEISFGTKYFQIMLICFISNLGRIFFPFVAVGFYYKLGIIVLEEFLPSIRFQFSPSMCLVSLCIENIASQSRLSFLATSATEH
jgi:hypothetical protein